MPSAVDGHFSEVAMRGTIGTNNAIFSLQQAATIRRMFERGAWAECPVCARALETLVGGVGFGVWLLRCRDCKKLAVMDNAAGEMVA